MEDIYYVLIILGISFGLIALYIILRSMKVIGAIPILSDVIDPILNAPFGTRMTMKTDEEVPKWVQRKILRTTESIVHKRLVGHEGEEWVKEDGLRPIVEMDNKVGGVVYEQETGDYVAYGMSFHIVNKDGESVDLSGGEGYTETINASIRGNLKKDEARLSSVDTEDEYHWVSKYKNGKVLGTEIES